MTEHYTHENFRYHAHIKMLITKSIDGKSLIVPVNNVINQFSLGSKLFHITSDGGTNLARYRAILEMGVFDLVKPMFLMQLISNLLSNSCKSVVIYLQYNYYRVDTEVTRRNMQCYIIWRKKSQKGAKDLETARKYVVLPCKRLITTLKIISYILSTPSDLFFKIRSINYLYEYMDNILDRIMEQKTYLIYLSVTSTNVTTMWRIVGSIFKTRPLVGSGSYLRQFLIL